MQDVYHQPQEPKKDPKIGCILCEYRVLHNSNRVMGILDYIIQGFGNRGLGFRLIGFRGCQVWGLYSLGGLGFWNHINPGFSMG